MLVVVSVKKTKLDTITKLVSDVTGEVWLHFNKNDQTKSYLIKEGDLKGE